MHIRLELYAICLIDSLALVMTFDNPSNHESLAMSLYSLALRLYLSAIFQCLF